VLTGHGRDYAFFSNGLPTASSRLRAPMLAFSPALRDHVTERFWGEAAMKKLVGLIVILSLSACSVCKSSDSPEMCRTKQREHGHPDFAITMGSSWLSSRPVLVEYR
jgi:hypothetical protein